MADFILTLKAFFHPDVVVPEEEEKHRAAANERAARAQELRETLKTNPSLERKIDEVTSLLSGAEKT